LEFEFFVLFDVEVTLIIFSETNTMIYEFSSDGLAALTHKAEHITTLLHIWTVWRSSKANFPFRGSTLAVGFDIYSASQIHNSKDDVKPHSQGIKEVSSFLWGSHVLLVHYTTTQALCNATIHTKYLTRGPYVVI
jgi:hypothetical protein